MSNQLIFVERPEHTKKALDLINEYENCQIVALGANVMWELGRTGQSFRIPYDYYDTEKLRHLNENLYERTREICEQLIKTGPTRNLLILGDFNDSYGTDNYEKSLGRDAIAVMSEGKGTEQLTWLTLPMVQENPDLATYHCEIKPKRYRSFLDHAFASSSLAEAMTSISVIDESIAYVASDHLPVICVFKLPGK